MRTALLTLVALILWSFAIAVLFGADFAQPESAEDTGANAAMAGIRLTAVAVWLTGVVVVGALGFFAFRRIGR
jgi:hypothetical protein